MVEFPKSIYFEPGDDIITLYKYIPDLGENAAGIVLFGVLWIMQTILAFNYKQWWFGVMFFIGSGLECATFIGRTLLGIDIVIKRCFLEQLICSLLAPYFLSAGLFHLLMKMIVIYGHKYFIIRPLYFSILFAGLNIISIVLLAIGGAKANYKFRYSLDPSKEVSVMAAGVAMQLAAITMFLIIGLDVYMKTKNKNLWGFKFKQAFNSAINSCGQSSSNLPDGSPNNLQRLQKNFLTRPPEYENIRNHPYIKYLWLAGFLAALFIWIRCIYKLVMFAGIWQTVGIRNEAYFLILDGLMIFFAILIMTIVHPGYIYGDQPIPLVCLKKAFNSGASV